MQFVGLVLGGVVGTIVFGPQSWGFYVSIFVGGIVGGALASRNVDSSTAAPINDKAQDLKIRTELPNVEKSVILKNRATSVGKPIKFHLGSRMAIIVITLAVLCSAIWFALQGENPSKKQDVLDGGNNRPVINVAIWDQRRCFRTLFPKSGSMAVPPEIDMYCAHPWNQVTMKKLRDALHRAKISFADITPDYPELATMIESIPNKELRDFALIERLLPLAKADEAMTARLKDVFAPATLAKLRIFKANIPWDDDPTENWLTRYYLGHNVTLVTDQFDIKSVAELADAIFIRITANTVINQTMGGNIAKLLDWRGVLASANPFMTLMFLQFNRISEEAFFRAPPYETAWSKSSYDYEIYFTDALPDWPCGGESLSGRRAALLCPRDARLFVSVAPLEATGDIYAELGGTPIFKLPPAFFHEMAHMFRDPINRQSQPFLVEGRATAEGERSLQIFRAVAAKANDTSIIDDSKQFLKSITDPNYAGPSKVSTNNIDEIINEQPFTVFQSAAACHVGEAALDTNYIVRQLEMPPDFFNNQAVDQLRQSYYAAWSLFHYGDEKPGLRYGGDRLDASIVREVADLVAQNRPVEGQNLIELGTYLSSIQELVRIDIKRKNLSCLKSESPRPKNQGG